VISSLRLLLTALLVFTPHGLMGSSFDPRLAARADSIPGQVPTAAVVFADSPDGRILRGDFEVPDRVLVVYSRSWPKATEHIAAQVLESGARLGMLLEADSSRGKLDRLLGNLSGRHGDRVEVLDAVVDTPWVRDWGPLQLRRGETSLWLDADYDDAERAADDDAPRWLAQMHAVELAEFPWALDGGAFVSNGAGLCVLTFEYLDTQGISWDDGDLGGLLDQLGCRATALIPTLVTEQTKHADMVAQFVAPTRLMLAQIIDDVGGHGEDAQRLQAAELGIRAAARWLGHELEIVRIPTPPARRWQNPRSYVNGLRLADRYLMPSYPELGEVWESGARAAVQEAMADVPVVPIDTSEMIAIGGSIHCASLGLFSR
jgi:agmatine/peptidylarginine deiminase